MTRYPFFRFTAFADWAPILIICSPPPSTNPELNRSPGIKTIKCRSGRQAKESRAVLIATFEVLTDVREIVLTPERCREDETRCITPGSASVLGAAPAQPA